MPNPNQFPFDEWGFMACLFGLWGLANLEERMGRSLIEVAGFKKIRVPPMETKIETATVTEYRFFVPVTTTTTATVTAAHTPTPLDEFIPQLVSDLSDSTAIWPLILLLLLFISLVAGMFMMKHSLSSHRVGGRQTAQKDQLKERKKAYEDAYRGFRFLESAVKECLRKGQRYIRERVHETYVIQRSLLDLLDNLGPKFEEKEQEVNTMKDKLSERHGTIRNLEAKLSDSLSNRRSLEARLKALQSDLATQATLLTQAQNRQHAEALAIQMSSTFRRRAPPLTAEELSDPEREIQKLKRSILRTESESATLKNRIEEVRVEKTELVKQIATLKNQKSDILQQLAHAIEETSKMEEELPGKIRLAQQETRDELSKENQSILQQKERDHQMALDQLRVTIQSELNKVHQEKLATAVAETASETTAKHEAEEEIQRMRRQLEAVINLDKNIADSLRTQLENANQAEAKQKKQVNVLKAQGIEDKKVIAALNAQLDQERVKNAELSESSLNEKIKDLEDQKAKDNDSIAALQKDLETHVAEDKGNTEALQEELEKSKKEKTDLEKAASEEVNNLRNQVNELNQRLGESSQNHSQAEQARQEVANLRNQVNELNQRLGSASSQNRTQAEQAHQEIANLRNQVNELNQKLGASSQDRSQAEQAHQEIANLRNQVNELNQRLDGASSQNRTQVEQAHQEVTNLRNQVNELNQRLQNAGSQNHSQAEEAYREVANLQNQVNVLKQHLEEASKTGLNQFERLEEAEVQRRADIQKIQELEEKVNGYEMDALIFQAFNEPDEPAPPTAESFDFSVPPTATPNTLNNAPQAGAGPSTAQPFAFNIPPAVTPNVQNDEPQALSATSTAAVSDTSLPGLFAPPSIEQSGPSDTDSQPQNSVSIQELVARRPIRAARTRQRPQRFNIILPLPSSQSLPAQASSSQPVFEAAGLLRSLVPARGAQAPGTTASSSGASHQTDDNITANTVQQILNYQQNQTHEYPNPLAPFNANDPETNPYYYLEQDQLASIIGDFPFSTTASDLSAAAPAVAPAVQNPNANIDPRLLGIDNAGNDIDFSTVNPMLRPDFDPSESSLYHPIPPAVAANASINALAPPPSMLLTPASPPLEEQSGETEPRTPTEEELFAMMEEARKL
ncbi:MAG: hypothetical protein Q9190_001903 [Brigantiaea leucoxantha]